MMARSFVALLLLAQLGSRSALASEPVRNSAEVEEEATLHFRRGVELYDEADFVGARVEFRRAYAIAPNFRVLYNMAQAEFQLQNYAAALRSFRQYLTEGGADVPAARRAEVETEIAKLERRVASLRITVSQPRARVFVDDVQVGESPLETPVAASTGVRRVVVKKQGFIAWGKSFEVVGGDVVDVAVDLLPEVPAAAAASPNEPGRATDAARVLGWWGVGVGGALLVTGAALDLFVLGSTHRSFDRAVASGDPAAESLASRAATERSLSIGAYGAGGVLALAGAAVLLFVPVSAGAPAAR